MPGRTFVALLRGINVGGRNRVPMAELRSAFASLGHEQVVTYIQSGNVVFDASGSDELEVAGGIEARVAEVFGVQATVVLRTPAELERIARDNPFLGRGADEARLHVVFLTSAPTPGALARLDPDRSPPDEFELRGRELYLHLPNGAGRSKLTVDYFESRLGVRGTARNLNTLGKLIELARR